MNIGDNISKAERALGGKSYQISIDALKKDLSDGKSIKEQRTALGGNVWRKRTDDTGGYQFMPITLDGIALWEPSIKITGRKNIVQTSMVERGGSVKEIVSIDDYVINIKGLIKRKDGLWPDEELTRLSEIWQKNEAVPIICAKTAILLNGNEYVTISSIDLPDKQGFVQSVEYAIECMSDIPFTLEMSEDDGNV